MERKLIERTKAIFLGLSILSTAGGPEVVMAGGLALPQGNEGIEFAFSSVSPLPPTEEELSPPPIGEIRKLDLREVNRVRAKLAEIIPKEAMRLQNSDRVRWRNLQIIREGLDRLSASRRESDLLSLIPVMDQIFTDNPPQAGSVVTALNWLEGISPLLLHAVARRITEKEGAVTIREVQNFTRVFSASRGFKAEGDWEEERPPVDAAGIMILNAAAVVQQLKSEGWHRAERFLGGHRQPTEYFARYVGAGDGLAVLKKEYEKRRVETDAKFAELKTWVDQQRQAAEMP